MKRGKRGEGSPVANFILMLALFIVIYIILLPPAAKEATLTPIPGYPTEPGITGGKVLLSESPGLVRPYLKEVLSQKLAPLNLFSYTETEPRILVRSLTTYTSFFSTKKEELKFDLPELYQLTQLSTLFLVQEGKGRLILKINGQEFYNDVVSSADLPIEIPLQYLKTKDNVLELSVSSPGANIFGTNTYYLKDIQLIKRFAVQNAREARNFIVTEGEYKSLARSILSYFVNCLRVRELGSLNIYLNGKEISSRFLVCDAGHVELEINPDDIVVGENKLEFEVDSGQYVLEQLILDHELESEDYPKYFFSLQTWEYLNVQDVYANVDLELEFDDYGYRKAATIIVNGERIYLDTQDRRALIDISDFVIEGENFIKIIPRENFDIVNLQVVMR